MEGTVVDIDGRRGGDGIARFGSGDLDVVLRPAGEMQDWGVQAQDLKHERKAAR